MSTICYYTSTFMDFEQAIQNFPQQLAYEPVIMNKELVGTYEHFVVIGMGGSNLCTELIQHINPELDITVHRDYGLPSIPLEQLTQSLIILSSYSGTTEEVLDALEYAHHHHLPTFAISVGGTLLERAKEYGIPFIQLPNTGIPPRLSLGYRLKALLTVMRQDQACAELTKLSTTINTDHLRDEAAQLSGLLENRIPLLYTSTRNACLGYAWKIAMNENAKIPAFCNVIPEMNHNEMNSFFNHPATAMLRQSFYALIWQDQSDHLRVQKRMEELERILQEQGQGVARFPLQGQTWLERIMCSVMVSMWTSFFLAQNYGIDPEPVPMVEEFKTLIAHTNVS